MKRKLSSASENKNLNFSLREYIYFFLKALIFPGQYAKLVSIYPSYKEAFFFFLINLFLALVMLTLVETYSLSVNLIFSFISEIISFVPFSIFLLLFITSLLHLLSKLIGGKGNFKDSFKAVCYSTIFLLFLPIKYLQILGIVCLIILLIYNFKQFQKFSLIKAVFTITLPSLVIILFLIMIGIINPLNLP